MNLITACESCNQGKGARDLSDDHVIVKAHEQAKLLNAHREQMEMMFEWHHELKKIDEDQINRLSDYWMSLTGIPFNKDDKKIINKLIKKYSISEILDAMEIANKQYIKYEHGEIIPDTLDEAISRIGGILRIKKNSKNDPYLADIFYIRGILRKRLYYVDENNILSMLHDAVQSNPNIEFLKELAKTTQNWTSFKNELEYFIENPN